MKTFINALICTLFLVGCSDSKGILFKDYAYKSLEKNYEYKKVGLFMRLRGKEQQINDSLSIRGGEEYDLLMSFSSPKKLESDIIIESLQLQNLDKGIAVLVVEDNTKKFVIDSDNMYSAYFSFYKMKMPYDNYSIKLKFRFSDSNKTYSFESKFTKDYKEEVITLWDQLMGI